MDNIDDHDFTVSDNPLPQACSTEMKASRPTKPHSISEDNEEESSFSPAYEALLEMRRKLAILDDSDSSSEHSHNPSKEDKNQSDTFKSIDTHVQDSSHPASLLPKTLEASSFSHVLSTSDLDRDEDFCKMNFAGIPQGNFSITHIENSNINPPNFMPVEDSLFGNLKHETFEYMPRSSFEMNFSQFIESQGIPKTEVSGESKLSAGIPTLRDISHVLKKFDIHTNATVLMNEVLKAGIDHPAQEQTNAARQPSASAHQLPNNTQQLMSNTNEPGIDHPAQEQTNAARQPSASAHQLPNNTQQLMSYTNEPASVLTLEDVLIWGSVDTGSKSMKLVNLLHTLTNEEIKYTISLLGCDAFQIISLSPKRKYKRLATVSVFNKACYQFGITFLPENSGPAVGTLKISSTGHTNAKYIKLMAYGGRSNLLLSNITMNLDGSYGDKSLIVNSDLLLRLKFKNGGTACSFIYFYIENMAEYFVLPECNYALIGQGEQREFCIELTPDRQFLRNLISFFPGNVTEITKVTIIYGEESTRQRVRNACQLYSESFSARKVYKTYKELLRLPEIQSETHGLHDTIETMSLLIQDGFHKIDVPIQINKKSICDFLERNVETVITDTNNTRLDLVIKPLKFS